MDRLASLAPLVTLFGAVLAAALAFALHRSKVLKDRRFAIRQERRDVYAQELAAATEVEHLLHRIVNQHMTTAPPASVEAIQAANIRHAVEHAKVQVVGTDDAAAAVDTLGEALTVAIRACLAPQIDRSRAMAAVKKVQEACRPVLAQIREELGEVK